MNENLSPLQRKSKTAAYLLTTGLVIEVITLYWAHPTSFLLFISLGGLPIVAGIVIYLFALVSA